MLEKQRDTASHIFLEDDDGNRMGPLDTKQGNCFCSMALPRKGDKIQIDDRNGEWAVIDVIHTLCTATPLVGVTLRVREVSSVLKEDEKD